MNKQAIIEAAKEVGRLALFAALTAVVGWAGQQVNAFDPTTLQYVLGTAALRFVDKYLHKSPDTKLNGVAPF